MTTTDPDSIPTVYTRSAVLALWGVRARLWGKAVVMAPIVLVFAVGRVLARIGGSVVTARQAIMITTACACPPVATAGLAGIYWGVLVACPCLLLLAWATAEERT